MSTAVESVLAAGEDLPEDIGKAGPLGLLLIVVLLIATSLLVRSMSGRLKKLPRSFDPEDQVEHVEIPDDLSGLDDSPPAPGQALLDTLRRAPLAIEPPRTDDGRPEGSATQR